MGNAKTIKAVLLVVSRRTVDSIVAILDLPDWF